MRTKTKIILLTQSMKKITVEIKIYSDNAMQHGCVDEQKLRERKHTLYNYTFQSRSGSLTKMSMVQSSKLGELRRARRTCVM